MVRELPTFKGYTVDVRLKQFRKVEYGKRIEFIDFSSPEGDEILAEYLDTLDLTQSNDNEIFERIVDTF